MSISSPLLSIDLGILKILAFAFFAGMFVLILARIVMAPRGQYDAQSMIPLSDDQIVEPRKEASAND